MMIADDDGEPGMTATGMGISRLGIGMMLLLAVVFPGHAGQVAYFSYKDGQKALGLFNDVRRIRLYCKPCGDAKPRLKEVVVVNLRRINGRKLYRLKINGRPVDLAYVYVPYQGKWYNAAMLLEFPVKGVSRVLSNR